MGSLSFVFKLPDIFKFLYVKKPSSLAVGGKLAVPVVMFKTSIATEAVSHFEGLPLSHTMY